MIRLFIVFAVAHTAELTKKTISAARIIGLRPNMSENLLHIGPDAAVARRYAPPIQV
jgi:hypothetical protein